MIYQVVKVNTSKHVQSLKDSFSYLPAFITLNNLHGPRNPVNIYVSTYISELWSNGSLISDLPLTQLTEASTRAGRNNMSGRLFATDLSMASYVGGQGLCTHPLVACPTACPQIFISFWHIAVTEFDFLSVSSLKQGMRNGSARFLFLWSIFWFGHEIIVNIFLSTDMLPHIWAQRSISVYLTIKYSIKYI